MWRERERQKGGRGERERKRERGRLQRFSQGCRNQKKKILIFAPKTDILLRGWKSSGSGDPDNDRTRYLIDLSESRESIENQFVIVVTNGNTLDVNNELNYGQS